VCAVGERCVVVIWIDILYCERSHSLWIEFIPGAYNWVFSFFSLLKSE